tara:strand:- start:33 stop:3317 length:3285 start_codon:yes stop_codon:yes gene_type:complete
MAKDKVEVPSIQIGANAPGLAFGGVVYSADSQVGYAGNSTKLNINVALDSQLSSSTGSSGSSGSSGVRGARDFSISNSDLDLSSPVDIKFAGQNLFRNMFLSSFETSTSVGDKLLHLTYSDGSVLLDRIFVGLIHEHFGVTKQKHGVPHQIEFVLKCPTVKNVQIDTVGQKSISIPTCSADEYQFTTRRALRLLSSPTGDPLKKYKIIRQSAQNIWSGGYIVVGTEEFTQSMCDIADVSYSFDDLISSVREFGISVDLRRFPNRKSNRYYKKNYSGTLKDVLQNWGNDLGISFYWDFTSLAPTLVVVDLTDRSIQAKFESAIRGIDGLDKGHGSDFTSGSNIVINSKNHSKSLDGTYGQAFTSKFVRGPGAKESNKKKSGQVYFSCQTLNVLANTTGGRDGIPVKSNLMGRSIRDFETSMMLGKYAPDLRDIYNARRAIQIYDKASPSTAFSKSEGFFKAIGFTDVIGITFGRSAISQKIRSEILNHAGIHNMISNNQIKLAGEDGGVVPVGPDGQDYHIFFGIKDDTVKEYINNVEQSIANEFYGRHYVLGVPGAEHFDCSPLYKILEQVEVQPSSEFYGGNQWYKTPMAKFLQSLTDLRVEGQVQQGNIYVDRLSKEIGDLRKSLADQCKLNFYNNRRQNGLFHFERNAPWMASKDDVERILNPFVLSKENKHVHEKPNYISSDTRSRTKTNLVKHYIPFLTDMPTISQLVARFKGNDVIARAYDMVESQKSLGKSIGMCFVLKNPDGGFSPQRIGDVSIVRNGLQPNIIEEINALSSLCDKQDGVTAKDTEECTTVCERDLAEEMCSSNMFGQVGLSCGEAEAIKDSLYSTELLDVKNHINGERMTIKRHNTSVKVSGTGGFRGSEKLYSDVASGGAEKPATTITMPSQNNHGGVLTYNRQLTVTDFGVAAVFDGLDKVAPVITPQMSSIKYQVQDLTQDVNSVFSQDNRAAIVAGEIPIDIMDDFIGATLQSQLGSDGDLSFVKLGTRTAQEYHNLIKANLAPSVDTVRENVNYKIYIDAVGGLSQLAQYLKQENGLDSLSISRDENGYYLSVAMSNRPPLVPELDAIFRKVGPISRAVQPKNAFYRSMS